MCRTWLRAAIVVACLLPFAAGADDQAVCTDNTTAPDAAIPACSRIIESGQAQGHDLAVAYRFRGVALGRKGDFDHAISDFDQAILLDPNFALAYRGRGFAWERKGDLDRAIAEDGEAIRLDPKDSIAFNNRGFAWQRKGDLDRAIADYDEAIRLAPNNAQAFNNRGYSRQRKGDRDGAIADYTEAIRLNPNFLLAYFHRGTIWRAKGDFDRAVADYTEAIRLDPGNTNAFASRGLAYEGKRDLERARTDFKAALALPPKNDVDKWGRDTSQARLAVLTQGSSTSPGMATASRATGSRLALVIGNGAYRNAPPLPNPPGDARAVAKVLRGVGFQVVEATDLDRGAMERAILEFLQKAASARVRLVFFAGHGIQVDGSNYLVPIDAKVASKGTAAFELIDLDRVLKGLDDEAQANIIILDSCRDNPFETRIGASRSARGAGLAGYSSVAPGTLIAFATAPGNTAADGAGAHSPFTTALLKHIGTPKLEVTQMLTRVRVDVVAATEKKQVPWVNTSLLGEVYLTADQQPVAAR
jgi:tetratricopeptide (TPR) repeat protein